MIKYDLTARNLEVDAKMKSYVDDKIAGLEKYVPRTARIATTCTVILEDDPSGREDNRFVCEAIISAPGAKMVSREGTINIYAAIDIVEAKLKSQLTKYKEKTTTEPRRHRMISRLTGHVDEVGSELAE
jgi:putative sigma-54 modulation protein